MADAEPPPPRPEGKGPAAAGGRELRDDELVVGRLGRAHGIKGDVAVDVRTDDVDRRFAPGSVLGTDRDVPASLTVRLARWHSGRLLVAFEEVRDRTAAEALRGVLLVVPLDSAAELDDPDEFWDHQLLGLAVHTVDGVALGVVSEVVHVPGSSLLAVQRDGADELLVPFVRAVVPEVDLARRLLLVDPPPGLVEPLPADPSA